MHLCLMGILNVKDLTEIADQKLQTKEYDVAATIYSTALHLPIDDIFLEEVDSIAEHIYRKRAECWFRLDEDVKAIEDSSEAIKFAARGKGTNNLMAKSLFIKIKAMERLGEFIEVLPFAVLCKHLRPKCEKTLRTLTRVKEKINKMIREDERVANQILIRMVACGQEEMERGQFELALDHFSELLELLYFKIVPGVLLMKAECLLKLGRHKEAKESCEKVLVYESNNKIARKLMQQISEKLKNLDGTKEEKAVCTVGKKKADDRKEYKSTKTVGRQYVRSAFSIRWVVSKRSMD